MEQVLNVKIYKDNKDLILVVKDSNPEIEKVITSVLCSICKGQGEINTTEISEIAPVIEKDKTPSITNVEDITPEFLKNPETDEKGEEVVVEDDIEDYSGHIVTMNGKYATSKLTIQQIFEKDASWIEFIATKSKSHHQDVEKIRKFYTSHKK